MGLFPQKWTQLYLYIITQIKICCLFLRTDFNNVNSAVHLKIPRMLMLDVVLCFKYRALQTYLLSKTYILAMARKIGK